MNKVQTDNSFLLAKVKLRMNHLPETDPVRVLDAYCGNGIIWDYIKKKSGRDIRVLGIDKKADAAMIYLIGDNVKFMKRMRLEKFDVIDLDAYGVPFEQLEYVLSYDKKKNLHHRIFVTFIQSVFGRLPDGMLKRLGFTEAMIQKIPTLIMRNGIEKFKNYLALMGVKNISIKSEIKKHYLFLET
jgi:SAM-dependent methyltransferase